MWIYWLLIKLTIIKFGLGQSSDLNTELGIPGSTLDFLENDQSIIMFQPRLGKRYNNLEYVVLKDQSPDERNETPNYQEDVRQPVDARDVNDTQSRINLGFLFGERRNFAGRPTRRIPTSDRNNGFGAQNYGDNPYLFPSGNEFTTKRSTKPSTKKYSYDQTTRRNSNKQAQSQWGSISGPSREESNEWSGAQVPNWQQPAQSFGQNSWEQPSNVFNNQNPLQSFTQNQQNWGSPFEGSISWEVQPSQPNNQNNWQSSTSNRKPDFGNEQSNSNGWSNEDKPTWGSPTQSWTTKKPFSSGGNWQQTTTTKKTNSWWAGNSDDQQPVWTEKTTTSGRYRPSSTKRPQRKSISELKCEEYSKPYTQTINALPLSIDPDILSIKVGKCDRNAQALIVGGQRSELGEFPHMVAVGFKTGRGLSWNCGGSLVSENFVLTAAHCTDSSLGKPVAVRLGELNLVRNDDGASPENFKVVQVFAHPEYRTSKKYNDIALLRLDRSVTFTNNVRPACLNTQDYISVNKAIATGWGSIGFGDRSSEVLLKVGLSFIDNRKCGSLYQSEPSSSLSQGIVESQLCAGELQGGYDTCLGDSGGPLQVTSDSNKCIYKIVGITSFGKFCGERNSPGVYTRVSSFVTWIESVVWP